MKAIKDGGPAFPIKGYCADASGALCGEVVVAPGMSLRDHFAGLAMHGELASQTDDEFYDDSDEDAEKLANWAYVMADAMLAAREDRP